MTISSALRGLEIGLNIPDSSAGINVAMVGQRQTSV